MTPISHLFLCKLYFSKEYAKSIPHPFLFVYALLRFMPVVAKTIKIFKRSSFVDKIQNLKNILFKGKSCHKTII